MKDVASIWGRVKAVLQETVPAAVAALMPPATQSAIAAAEEQTGLKFPEDLRSLLLIHNGQAEPYMSEVLFDNEYFLSAERIASTWAGRTDVAKSLVAGGDYTPDTIGRWWEAKYLPFTESDGDGFCVHSESGVVARHVHDQGMEELPGRPQLGEWFLQIAEKLEAGKFKVEHGSVWLDLDE